MNIELRVEKLPMLPISNRSCSSIVWGRRGDALCFLGEGGQVPFPQEASS